MPRILKADEIEIREEHNTYPAIINAVANGNENNRFPHLTVWPIAGIIIAALLLLCIMQKICRCIKKAKTKKEAKRIEAMEARDRRLEALALAPMKLHDEKFEEISEKIGEMQKVVEVHPPKWDKDRFEEINEKLDQLKITRVEQPEKTGIAASPTAMAHLPPVAFMDPANQFAQMQSLALSQRPSVTFLDNGRPRRYRGRRY